MSGKNEPTAPQPLMTPERFRRLVSSVLIVGVVTAGILVSIGLLAAIVVGWEGSLVGAPTADRSTTSFSGIGSGLLALRPVAIAQVGVLVLLATPVARVAASVVGFALERDRLYVGITVVVLVVLLLSIFVIR